LKSRQFPVLGVFCLHSYFYLALATLKGLGVLHGNRFCSKETTLSQRGSQVEYSELHAGILRFSMRRCRRQRDVGESAGQPRPKGGGGKAPFIPIGGRLEQQGNRTNENQYILGENVAQPKTSGGDGGHALIRTERSEGRSFDCTRLSFPDMAQLAGNSSKG